VTPATELPTSMPVDSRQSPMGHADGRRAEQVGASAPTFDDLLHMLVGADGAGYPRLPTRRRVH